MTFACLFSIVSLETVLKTECYGYSDYHIYRIWRFNTSYANMYDHSFTVFCPNMIERRVTILKTFFPHFEEVMAKTKVSIIPRKIFPLGWGEGRFP